MANEGPDDGKVSGGAGPNGKHLSARDLMRCERYMKRAAKWRRAIQVARGSAGIGGFSGLRFAYPGYFAEF